MFLVRLALAARRMARRFRPDVVLAGSGLTAPIARMAARAVGARYAVFVYGLDLVVGSVIYQSLWLPAIRKADRIFPISAYTRQVAIDRGLDAGRMALVTPGVDPPSGPAPDAAAFRSRYALEDRPVLLTVGRLTNRKGVAEFVEKSLPAVVRAFPRAMLVVIGGEPSDALAGNKGGATERVRAAAAANGISDHVLLLGRCEDDVVAAAFVAADVHVFPVIEIPGDVEGFGMVAIEAASHGLPTVAFRVGGIPDAIEDGVSGRLIAPGDYAALSEAIGSYLAPSGERAALRDACIAHARAFDWRAIGRRLAHVLDEAIAVPR
jgi:phosphatidylinositol alpha-1,6-mannosyltransferase